MQISAEGEEGVTAVGLSHVFDVLQVQHAIAEQSLQNVGPLKMATDLDLVGHSHPAMKLDCRRAHIA